MPLLQLFNLLVEPSSLSLNIEGLGSEMLAIGFCEATQEVRGEDLFEPPDDVSLDYLRGDVCDEDF